MKSFCVDNRFYTEYCFGFYGQGFFGYGIEQKTH